MSRKEKKKHNKYSLSDEEPPPVVEPAETDTGLSSQLDSAAEGLLSSLAIRREFLDQLAESLPKPHTGTSAEKRVFVRKLRPVSEPSERPLSKSVKVARPLPPGYPAVPAPSLGRTPGPLSCIPGPRYSADGQLVAHSVLGTEEELSSAAEARTGRQLAVAPASRERRERTRPRRTWFPQRPREEGALRHWRLRMEERQRLQERVGTRVRRPAGLLVMNRSDDYSDRQTVRALLDRAAPLLEAGKGFRSGSEFWQQPERLGDHETGVRMSLTSSERGMPPQVQLIGRPEVTRRETGTAFPAALPTPSYPWKQSRYLSARLRHLAPILQELSPLDPALSSLCLLGRAPQKRDIRLDSAGGSESSSEGEEDAGGRAEEERGGGSPEGCLAPAVLVQGQHSLSLGGSEPVQLRLSLEASTGQLARTCVSLENVGPSVVFAVWRKKRRDNSLQRTLEAGVQRFYFDLREKVLLPGHAVSVPVLFKSAQAGVYWESWELATRPSLRPLLLTFRGVAVSKDRHRQARAQVERDLVGSQAEISAGVIVQEIIQSVRTPPRSPLPLRVDRTREEKFTRVNPGVTFREDSFRALQTLYTQTFNPPILSEGSESAEGRKEAKSGVKKDETKGKTSKSKKPDKSEKREEVVASKLTIVPRQLEVPVMSAEKVSEAMRDLPEWDLTLSSLVNAVLNTSGNEMQSDLLLARLNEILSRLNFSQHRTQLSTAYQQMYVSLSQALEGIPPVSAKIRSFYNLPEKLFVDETQAEMSESVVSPSDLSKRKKGGQSKPDVGKKQAPRKSLGKEEAVPKPKGSTPSRKGKASVTPRTLQESAAPVDTTPELPRSVEVDPLAERAYSSQLRQAVCDLLDAAVGNFVRTVHA